MLDGRPTKSSMTSLVVKGDSIEAAYDFEVKGHRASSRIAGRKTGETFSGTFQTSYRQGRRHRHVEDEPEEVADSEEGDQPETNSCIRK